MGNCVRMCSSKQVSINLTTHTGKQTRRREMKTQTYKTVLPTSLIKLLLEILSVNGCFQNKPGLVCVSIWTKMSDDMSEYYCIYSMVMGGISKPASCLASTSSLLEYATVYIFYCSICISFIVLYCMIIAAFRRSFIQK